MNHPEALFTTGGGQDGAPIDGGDCCLDITGMEVLDLLKVTPWWHANRQEAVRQATDKGSIVGACRS